MANPVLLRELRGRWRRPLTFLILLSYATILALLMRQVYASNSVTSSDVDASARQLGRQLFGGFFWMQTAIWMLLATSLTATSISGERERGLLQGVLLSPMTAGQVVRGKIGASMWFIGLLLLVPMPITALCFTLGGLSPGEFALAFLLLCTTALSGACLGMATSACHQRSDSALLMALIITLSLSWPPVLVARSFDSSYFPLAVLCCVIYQLMMIASSLGVATDAVNNLIPEPEVETAVMSVAAQQEARQAARNAPTEQVMAFDPMDFATTSTADNFARMQSDYRELPWAARLRFANPVMQREVRARLRRRMEYVALDNATDGERQFVVSTGPMDWVLAGAIVTLLVSFPVIASGSGASLAVLWTIFVVMVATAFGAMGFTREREQQTLQPLLMALLSPRDVVAGKVGASCMLAAVYGAPFLPIIAIALCTRPLILLATVALACTGVWLATAIGLCFSWMCRQTSVATACALGAVFALIGLVRMLPILLSPTYLLGALLYFWPPSASRARLLSPTNDTDVLRAALILSVVLAIGGGALLTLLRSRLRPKVLNRDATSLWTRDLTKDL